MHKLLGLLCAGHQECLHTWKAGGTPPQSVGHCRASLGIFLSSAIDWQSFSIHLSDNSLMGLGPGKS